MPQRWSETRAIADQSDRDACRDAIKTGSRSFYAASLLLPSRLRDPAYALYAFCRLSDDAVDLRDRDGVDGDEAVARLHDRLGRAYAGRPVDAPADRALADAVAAFDIPRALPEALLEGLQWDTEGRRYETLSGLKDYAARVAGAVGAMMAALMSARDAASAARACDLGVAMQLTNIARDVGEDARAGRIYLPLSWLREVGITPEALTKEPVFSPALGGVVARLLAEADALYRRAEPGIAALPADCRPAIWSARLLYAEIGAEVARSGCDSVAQRAVVSKQRKLALVGRATALSLRSSASVARSALEAPPLDEVRYLVDALVETKPRLETAADFAAEPAWWRYGDRLARCIDMMATLDDRRFGGALDAKKA